MESKAFYEESYARGGDGGQLYADWRALSAVGKADHVLALTPMSLQNGETRVLDIGCGDGALIAELARRHPRWRFAGVELAERAAILAAARCPDADIRSYDGETLPWAGGAFELATISHVLEHVPDPVAVLIEASRVAACVIIEVPLEENVSARRQVKRAVAGDVGHIQRFSLDDIAALTRRAGMCITADLADPLGRDVHTFFARSRAQRIRGTAKWFLRAGMCAIAPASAQRLFTTHYACRCESASAATMR